MPRVQLPSNESSLPKVVRIHVNIDHVATLRNARGTTYPDPVLAARHCLDAGAHGITAHLREDRRHIRDEDVERLRSELRTTLNLEMAATDEMLAIALRIRPDVVTLVPERREERTTEGGLDVVGQKERLRAMCATLDDASIKTSLFVAPDLAQIDASAALGVAQVELHTGDYAHAVTAEERARTLGALEGAARAAAAARLEVAAGHGLTVANVVELMRISAIEELNVGHAVVADAIFSGMGAAVAALRGAVERGVRARA
ncbi:MAG: pyridoxine 5'-phosphate synthase [Myxococcales bacterium]|nr:pyridoxine 5'-phosphate synthase [Myxococcales bacterium]